MHFEMVGPWDVSGSFRTYQEYAGSRKMADMVRHALEEYLSKGSGGKAAYDGFLEAGLIGCAPGLPKDLATNKRHFKGFGKSK